MKKFLNIIIYKWPLKTLFIVMIIVISMAVFITNISLSTGNETLIDPKTDTYQDNFQYQEAFGTDPIMIVFDGETQSELLSYESLVTLNTLVDSLSDLDGIFYINSPIGVIDYVASISYNNYQDALNEISTGLFVMSDSIRTMNLTNDSFDVDTLLTTFENLSAAQRSISENSTNQLNSLTMMKTAASNEIIRLESLKDSLDPLTEQNDIQSLTQSIEILTNIVALYDQLIIGNTSLSTGATETALALDQISMSLSSAFSSFSALEMNIESLASNLETLATSVQGLSNNFNMFAPSFPSSSATLQTMIYPNGQLNPMLNNFLIDENHMYMSIILEESVTNDEIENILLTIDDQLDDTLYSKALVSGKPVLDYDIQSSMMESMKTMMISAGAIMVVILLVLFPVKLRLLPLMIVMIAVITTVSIMGIFSIPLTMVSMAVFPVLIGLGIDYSIQFHNRYIEETMEGVTNE